MKLYSIDYHEGNISKEHNRMCFTTRFVEGWHMHFADSIDKKIDFRINPIKIVVQTQQELFDVAKNWIDNGIISYAGHEFDISKPIEIPQEETKPIEVYED